ncbi:hypothetical protein PG994_006971 [Apiospora phragmitis]|uniref:Peptidase M14 carboxypeptidase A domain-containing protein n=1 Tax=Apiospora phragmitis TaxID=2905665 RepID=A0ABR1UZF9_9PEZI
MDIKILPRYNMDGVAYFQRQLAVNLDPNREHIKLMRRQSRGIKRIVSEYNPHISIDMHEFTAPTVYGGHYQHGADSLISGSINLNIHQAIRGQVLQSFIPAMGARLESYGLRWEHYATCASNSTPGHFFPARDARIRLGNQHFQRRVATALIKMEAILDLARDHTDGIYSKVEDAIAEFVDSNDDSVVTDSYPRSNRSFTMIDQRDGSVAYMISRSWADIAERLEILGLDVETLDHEFRGRVEAPTVVSSSLASRLYEGHVCNTVTTKAATREVVLPAGSFRVSTRQKNAALAFTMLEPENIDSYVTFNIIPVGRGEEYPVFRIPRS